VAKLASSRRWSGSAIPRRSSDGGQEFQIGINLARVLMKTGKEREREAAAWRFYRRGRRGGGVRVRRGRRDRRLRMNPCSPRTPARGEGRFRQVGSTCRQEGERGERTVLVRVLLGHGPFPGSGRNGSLWPFSIFFISFSFPFSDF
jgi:hypothetical protein